MPGERLHATSGPIQLPSPETKRAREIATGEQTSIGAPGQPEDRTGMRQLLQGGAQLRIPEPDGCIASPTGEQVSIGRKGQTVVALRMPTRPEQSTTLDIP